MKTLLILGIVVGVLATGALAKSPGGGSTQGDGEKTEKTEKKDSWRNSCKCKNQCAENNGTRNIGCYNNREQYLQCVDKTCSNHTCPEHHLFNYTTEKCEPCPEGFHVDAEKRACVCNNGTRLDWVKRKCVPCPHGATFLPDRCFCNGTIDDRKSKICRACPEGSVRKEDTCGCKEPKPFFNQETYTCEDCPGTWVNITTGSSRHRVTIKECQCHEKNQIFDIKKVECVTCPKNSIVSKKTPNHCECTVIGEIYERKNNTCVEVSPCKAHEKGFDRFEPFEPKPKH